jgi:hypothetical protein
VLDTPRGVAPPADAPFLARRPDFLHDLCMNAEHLDVLIVGAGLSGIGAGYHLQAECPGKSYAILESRGAIGGTWDLFRYPGIRSDSDMYTLGYRFRPWTAAKAIADGPSILEYVQETARENGIDRHIRFHHRVVRAEWSTADSRWTVEVQRTDTGETLELTAGFVLMCTGYYRYDEGYTPEFPGIERFGGMRLSELDDAGPRPLRTMWRVARDRLEQDYGDVTIGEMLDRYRRGGGGGVSAGA